MAFVTSLDPAKLGHDAGLYNHHSLEAQEDIQINAGGEVVICDGFSMTMESWELLMGALHRSRLHHHHLP